MHKSILLLVLAGVIQTALVPHLAIDAFSTDDNYENDVLFSIKSRTPD